MSYEFCANLSVFLKLLLFTNIIIRRTNKQNMHDSTNIFHLNCLNFKLYRTCVPAEAEPFLNSSSCYPLVNFSRPFCQNHGVTLPSYVYSTPSEQTDYNNRFYLNFKTYLNLGPSKASEYFRMDILSIKKCMKNVIILMCRFYFPSCDSTKNVFRKTKLCRESCLEFIDSCGPAWKLFEKYIKARYPHNIEKNKQAHCELQPYRNSGDSPECWYYNGHANITGNINNETIGPHS